MTPHEALPEGDVLDILLKYSADWEAEDSCYGYRRNKPADLEGRRVFVMSEGGAVVAYLFGHMARAEHNASIMAAGEGFFEVDELYVCPEWRGKGVGRALFRFMEKAVADETDYILLSTATKNWRAILHFYIDELGMEFWNARLYKRISIEGE